MVSILGSVARGSEDTLSSAAGRTLEPVAVELAKLEAGKGGGGGGGGFARVKERGGGVGVNLRGDRFCSFA